MLSNGRIPMEAAGLVPAAGRLAPMAMPGVNAIPPAPVSLRSSTAAWPPQAELVLSAIEAGQHRRRGAPRRRYRVLATLRLHSDATDAPPRPLYTRDIHHRGLGFITPTRLPLGHGGIIELPDADGGIQRIACTLLRCREAAPGWFEGAIYFNRDQPQFAEASFTELPVRNCKSKA